MNTESITQRVTIRVWGACDWGSIAFLDSPFDGSCNPGRMMFWDECGGHGEGYYRFHVNSSRPCPKEQQAAILALYCEQYGGNPADYRILQRAVRS